MSEETITLPRTQNVERIEQLKPPSGAHVSTILNGIGNYMMLGAMPTVVHAIHTGITGKSEMFGISSRSIGKIGAFSTVTGCIIGAAIGVSEARNLDNYRQGIYNEMIKMRSEVDANKTMIQSWTDKHHERTHETPRKEPAHSM